MEIAESSTFKITPPPYYCSPALSLYSVYMNLANFDNYVYSYIFLEFEYVSLRALEFLISMLELFCNLEI